MRIKIKSSLLEECREFADKRARDSAQLYKRRGESRIAKIKDDVLVGVVGEWATHLYLFENGIMTSKPDMEIHEIHEKSFDADLTNELQNFHVKSQSMSSASKYGYSWLCQKEDRLLCKPGDNDYFVFTGVNVPYVEILGIVKVQDIISNNLIGMPKIPRYQYTKIALYLDRIKESGVILAVEDLLA